MLPTYRLTIQEITNTVRYKFNILLRSPGYCFTVKNKNQKKVYYSNNFKGSLFIDCSNKKVLGWEHSGIHQTLG